MMPERLFAGIDVGGTHLRLGLVTENGELARDAIFPSSSISDTNGSTPARILKYIQLFLGQEIANIVAMCIGFPSVISKDRRIIVQTPNIAGLDNIPFAEMAEKEFSFPVFIEKDVNLLLIHDVATYNLSTKDPILGFYIGTGIGNAIMLNGDIMIGASGSAGELGHVPILGNKIACPCGNIGCVETIASGKALVNYKSTYPNMLIDDFFTQHSQDEFVKHFIELLAITISTEMNIFDPAVAILGGGVILMKDFPREWLISEIREHLRYPYPKNSVKFLFSEQTKNAGVFGAARWAKHLLERKQQSTI
jgi:allose kinase